MHLKMKSGLSWTTWSVESAFDREVSICSFSPLKFRGLLAYYLEGQRGRREQFKLLPVVNPGRLRDGGLCFVHCCHPLSLWICVQCYPWSLSLDDSVTIKEAFQSFEDLHLTTLKYGTIQDASAIKSPRIKNQTTGHIFIKRFLEAWRITWSYTPSLNSQKNPKPT